ncbi:MAG: EVE domain-containing protein [Flavobacteriales bacterium]|nr:EVE domain-containing protein [Flavobacteriales bacterium]
MNYWLIKSEPHKYSWEQFEKDGKTFWDGVRNYAARNNMRDMKLGDQCLFYHSNEGKEIVGIAEVERESYPDPTINDETWVAVDVKPIQKLSKTITLSEIKEHPVLKSMEMVRLNRLSVSKVTKKEFDLIKKLGS